MPPDGAKQYGAKLDRSARVADPKEIGDYDAVALEAGNSPSIIFKNYRELTTEEQTDKWFATVPKPDQWANTYAYDYKTRAVTLPDQTGT